MNTLWITPQQTIREHEERLRRASEQRRAGEAVRRMRIRSQLNKAILESVRLDGTTRDLAMEFAGMVRHAERRLTGNSCC